MVAKKARRRRGACNLAAGERYVIRQKADGTAICFDRCENRVVPLDVCHSIKVVGNEFRVLFHKNCTFDPKSNIPDTAKKTATGEAKVRLTYGDDE